MTSIESASESVPEVAVVAEGLRDRLEVLSTLSERPLDEHADVYQQLHSDLQATLAEIDSA